MGKKGNVILLLLGTLAIGTGLYFAFQSPVLAPDNKDDNKDKDNKTPNPSKGGVAGGVNFKVDQPAGSPKSKYGFSKGDKLYFKNERTNIYSYPQASNKYAIALVDRSLANGHFIFSNDSSVSGFIKASAGGKEVFILASQVTNVAP